MKNRLPFIVLLLINPCACYRPTYATIWFISSLAHVIAPPTLSFDPRYRSAHTIAQPIPPLRLVRVNRNCAICQANSTLFKIPKRLNKFTNKPILHFASNTNYGSECCVAAYRLLLTVADCR